MELWQKKLSRRSMNTGLLTLALGGSLVGCGSTSTSPASSSSLADLWSKEKPDLTGTAVVKGDPSLNATLTIWGWYNIVPKAVVSDFQKYYPNVKFNFVDFSTADTTTKLLTALNAGVGAPDICMVQDRDAPRFWKLGLLDLTKGVAPYQTDFPAFKWQKILRPNGTIQAVPWEAGPVQLVYRRDIFQQYGIDPTTSMQTWDDYINVGKTIVQKSGGKVRMLMSNIAENPNGSQTSLTSDFAILTEQNGGQYFDAKGNITVDRPPAVQALTLLKSFRDAGITLNDVASAQAEFATMKQGTIATYLAPVYWRFYPTGNAPETAGKWGAVPLPAFQSGGARASNRGGTSLSITNQCKSPEAAWEFLKFWLFRVESRIAAYKVGSLLENLFIPAAQNSFFQQPDPFFGGDHWLQDAYNAAIAAPPFNEGPLTDQLEQDFQTELPAFLNGQKDAQTMLSSVARTVEQNNS